MGEKPVKRRGKFAHLFGEERHKQPTSALDTPSRAGFLPRVPPAPSGGRETWLFQQKTKPTRRVRFGLVAKVWLLNS